ncbi:cellulose synthase-like protein B4 isoform X2 [Vicia villosa]|uniref:cellulose synthase-like protein B4 isoform X2 n=1 Tax=Vicia villosa TaxID=3911 RepID=UPI00273C4E3C|nr:cellulose synthase-like protein B4 isoform X2 [Vicia villosa]
MASQESLPLYDKIWIKRKFQRTIDILILLLLTSLLSFRLFSIINNTFTIPWFLAFSCESWFTFTWIVILNAKWSPAVTITHPNRLLQQVQELPRVDLFVTTADPVLEPPIITLNTVLSLLALDYPANKLACYVSDDACSVFTFYGLVEASKFAKFWVPFCKKYNIQVRAPFRYFSQVTKSEEGSSEFKQEWLQMKDMYDNLSRKVEDVTRNSLSFKFEGEFAVFLNTEKRNHPSIVKVISENKDDRSDGLPHLIYVSREKNPKYEHNYKAGAMNVLTRVSGLMTNAPFMLNVDCDMVVSYPKIIQHAVCILMDSKNGKDVAFVQCFQQFYDGIKDDPFGNQWVAAVEYIIRGMGGLQGPYYGGTNTFHRRNAIYGLDPHENHYGKKGKLSEKALIKQFGSSNEFVKSATHAFEGSGYSSSNGISPSNLIDSAIQVSDYGYEDGTSWGNQMGWLYGSISEDVPTGLNMHRKGWRSECCTPDQTAFTGCAPGGLLTTMVQQKRWASGLTVVFFGKHSPVMGILFGKIQIRAGLSYCWLTNWGLRSVFEVCYAALVAHCVITNTGIFPKGFGLWIPLTLFVIYTIHTLQEYRSKGLSLRHWWNNQRMVTMRTTSVWFIGFLCAMIKLLGISDTVFEITQKETPGSIATGDNADAGRFTFDESPAFVVGTTVLLVQLTALVVKILGLQLEANSGNECGLGEMMGSVYLVVCYWPFLKGLFARGKYGIPLSTIFKSVLLSLIFVHFCRIGVMS